MKLSMSVGQFLDLPVAERILRHSAEISVGLKLISHSLECIHFHKQFVIEFHVYGTTGNPKIFKMATE